MTLFEGCLKTFTRDWKDALNMMAVTCFAIYSVKLFIDILYILCCFIFWGTVYLAICLRTTHSTVENSHMEERQ
jgi:hypothetical protein